MGRTQPAKKQHTKATDPPVQHSKPPSFSALLEKAPALIVQCDYELAVRFVRRILEQQPENVEAREMLGVSLLEAEEIDAAKEAFQSSIFDTTVITSTTTTIGAHVLSEANSRLALQHDETVVDILVNQLKSKQAAKIQRRAMRGMKMKIKDNIMRALIV